MVKHNSRLQKYFLHVKNPKMETTTKLTNRREDITSRKLLSLLNLIEWKVKFGFISHCRRLEEA